MKKVELTNSRGTPITEIGELKRIIEPFVDSCEITPVNIFYVPLTNDFKGPAKLEIALERNRRNSEHSKKQRKELEKTNEKLRELVFDAYNEGWRDCEPKASNRQSWEASDSCYELSKLDE